MDTDWWITIALLALFLVVGVGMVASVRSVSHVRRGRLAPRSVDTPPRTQGPG
jgi:hypothetical protein